MKNVYKVNQGNPIFMEKLPQNVNSEGTNWKGRRREGGVCATNEKETRKLQLHIAHCCSRKFPRREKYLRK